KRDALPSTLFPPGCNFRPIRDVFQDFVWAITTNMKVFLPRMQVRPGVLTKLLIIRCSIEDQVPVNRQIVIMRKHVILYLTYNLFSGSTKSYEYRAEHLFGFCWCHTAIPPFL